MYHACIVHRQHPKYNRIAELFGLTHAVLCSSWPAYLSSTMKAFNQQALRIAQGKGEDDDINKMNPWLCESHAIHSVAQKVKAICKPWQIEVAAYCFVALARCTLLCTFLSLFKAIHTITTSKIRRQMYRMHLEWLRYIKYMLVQCTYSRVKVNITARMS